MPDPSSRDLAQKIEHLLIDPRLSRLDIEKNCQAARDRQCGAVVVQPHYIEPARRSLKESRVKIIALIGSPNGGTTTATKMYETQDALQRGADEIAMMVHLAALRDRDDLIVRNDVASVVQTARGHNVTVVLEDFLSVEEKTRACKIAEQARATFVQTSLGTTETEMTLANLKMLRPVARVPLIAAGRLDSAQSAIALIEAGAARIATSELERILE